MKIELDLTNDQLRDLRELLDEKAGSPPTVSGGSSVSSEVQRAYGSYREVLFQIDQSVNRV